MNEAVYGRWAKVEKVVKVAKAGRQAAVWLLARFGQMKGASRSAVCAQQVFGRLCLPEAPIHLREMIFENDALVNQKTQAIYPQQMLQKGQNRWAFLAWQESSKVSRLPDFEV